MLRNQKIGLNSPNIKILVITGCLFLGMSIVKIIESNCLTALSIDLPMSFYNPTSNLNLMPYYRSIQGRTPSHFNYNFGKDDTHVSEGYATLPPELEW